jgi:hypothetical protein
MSELQRLCDVCAKEGAAAMLHMLGGSEDLGALAEACMRRAEEADRSGDGVDAIRLRAGATCLTQYLAYVSLGYHLD